MLFIVLLGETALANIDLHSDSVHLPVLIGAAGARAGEKFIEFFAAQIRNRNTRAAYVRAVAKFLSWCDDQGLSLETIRPVHVAAYIEILGRDVSKATVKQTLAAVRSLFDYLVVNQVMPTNPAHSVRGPKLVIRKGKTPILQPDEASRLLSAIDTETLIGLRDRALLSVMLYSFARVSAVVAMQVEDFYPTGDRWMIRLHEKGGKERDLPAHHKVVENVNAYIKAAGIEEEKKTPLFRSMKWRKTSENGLERVRAWRMIRERAMGAGIAWQKIGCHSMRGTGITTYLSAGGRLEVAQEIAGHEAIKTTKLYDRRSQLVQQAEIERVQF